MPPRYLGSAAAAEYLGYGTGKKGSDAIRQLVHRRQLPHSKIGKTLRFDKVALDSWMARHRVRMRDTELETAI